MAFISIPESNSPKTSRAKKKILKAFKLLRFKIEIMFNLKAVNFLVIIFSLSENSFKPFHKHKQAASYISVYSDHPRSVSRQIPSVVNKKKINR